MEKLSRSCIYANAVQAMEQDERGNRTLQNRLLKEMRESGISDIDGALKFLLE